MKNVLITGANSYVGMAVEKWLLQEPNRYQVTTLDMLDHRWEKTDFGRYDVVYHVAGIAHADVEKVSEEKKQLYYQVNTDLAVAVANKAKQDGTGQFIFMSSMIVYSGCNAKVIRQDTVPDPQNFYGDSKWQADQKIQKLADDTFHVVILRPPMIYGKASKGNYPKLASMVGKLPFFPNVKNQRSMLYISNLCEFVRLMIDHEECGIFFPQNAEYTSTSQMVKKISEVRGHKIRMIQGIGWLIALLQHIPGKVGNMATKAFGDSCYEMVMSEYPENYRVVSLEQSIIETES